MKPDDYEQVSNHHRSKKTRNQAYNLKINDSAITKKTIEIVIEQKLDSHSEAWLAGSNTMTMVLKFQLELDDPRSKDSSVYIGPIRQITRP